MSYQIHGFRHHTFCYSNETIFKSTVATITMGDSVKVQDLDSQSQEMLSSLFKGSCESFVRAGQGGYVLPRDYREHADQIKSMPVRPDDIWVVTYPRSGTTWTQELVWLLMNDLDYETALKIPLLERIIAFPAPNDTEADPIIMELIDKVVPPVQRTNAAPSPRFIKTHLPLSLLPDNLLETARVVYVARDPRDVAVSYFHHNRSFKSLDFVGEFKEFWDLFVKDLITYTPYFPHLKEAWAQRHHPNMLFFFYEDLNRDMPETVRRVAMFLGKDISDDQIPKLRKHLDIESFRTNESINPTWMRESGSEETEGFIRKGKSGGWRSYFDETSAARAQAWLHSNLADTDLRFPDSYKDSNLH